MRYDDGGVVEEIGIGGDATVKVALIGGAIGGGESGSGDGERPVLDEGIITAMQTHFASSPHFAQGAAADRVAELLTPAQLRTAWARHCDTVLGKPAGRQANPDSRRNQKAARDAEDIRVARERQAREAQLDTEFRRLSFEARSDMTPQE